MKKINIILSIILILGILLSCFGGICMATAPKGNGETAKSDGTTENGQKDTQEETYLDLGDAKNEVSLSDDVKVFAGDAATNINNSITSIESVSGSYYSGGSLKITLNGSKEELFDDLESEDIFLLDGNKNTPLMAPYILKADSISDGDTETVIYVSQPDFTEVFESMDIGLSDTLTAKNLISAQTMPGVKGYFKSGSANAETLSTNGQQSYKVEKLSTGTNNSVEVKTVANDHSFDVGDFIIEFVNIRLNEKQDNEAKIGRIEAEYDKSLNLKGEIGIKNLTAHFVCDMPSKTQINELYMGLSGETYKSIGVEGKIDGSFKPKQTEWAHDGKHIDVSISGLNEKAIPLGIWHFAGTTLIKVSTGAYEQLRMTPSIFLMVYSDLEGNISFEFGIDFKHSETFNSGLRVFKEGKLWMQPEVYPYESIGGEIKKPEEETVWEVDFELDANLDLTLLGTSASFCIGGINIGEIALFELGFEAECDIGVEGNSIDGVKVSGDNAFYIRMYLKVMELKARVIFELEAFNREFSAGGDWQFCVFDFTLFEKGIKPDRFKTTPISSIPMPSEFDSVITIVGDVSGSMDSSVGTGETKLDAAKQAGKVITDMIESWSERYNGVFGLGVIQFSSSSKVLALPHIDYPFITLAIESMGDGGGTNIASGLESAIAQLEITKAQDKSIILMTDGEDSNHSGIKEQAQKAKDKGIKIYTIGFGNGADTQLLTDIADITGGEYKFADTSNMVGIIGGFMYAYQSSEAEVLGDYEGDVSQGETVDVGKFKVEEQEGDLNANLYWPGSFLELILIDPNNKEVDEDYPGVTIDNSTIPSTVSIEDPIPGKWEIKVKGVETSYEREPFYAITSFKELEEHNSKLEIHFVVGSYCLPLGIFMIITSIMFLVLVNSKKRQ